MTLQTNVPLAPFTTLGVGGAARYFAAVESDVSLAEALAWAQAQAAPVWILGGGSNLVVADGGVAGLVVHMRMKGREASPDGAGHVLVTAAAGESWDDLVLWTTRQGLVGIECLSGIPGQVGSTPIQNVGAYGQEVGDVVQRVRAMDRQTGRTVDFSAAECRFGYRDSRFKSEEPDRYVVLSVSYRLKTQAAPEIRYAELGRQLAHAGMAEPSAGQVREAVLALRRTKSMVLDSRDPNTRSAGSFFTNPLVTADMAERVAEIAGDAKTPRFPQADGRVKLSAAWLIQHAGFEKGSRQGAVGLSSNHTLAIVCHEGATAQDVVALAHTLRRGVWERFGVTLVPEPNFWGFSTTDDRLPD